MSQLVSSAALFLRNNCPEHDVNNVYSGDASTSPKAIYLHYRDNLCGSNHDHVLSPGDISRP